jgi:TorA maturation chaperone TorD
MTAASQTSAIRPEELTARSGVYRLLARLWLREVDEALWSALRQPPLSEFFTQAGGLPPEAEVDELAIDFCQLFLGPTGHLPPYQSVWERGQFQSPATSSMHAFADLIGYEFGSQPHAAMPDHLGVQLDVMASILEVVADAFAAEDATDCDRAAAGNRIDTATEVATTFFQRHLAWPEPLFLAAEPRATTGFYRSVIALTREFLHHEQRAWTLME